MKKKIFNQITTKIMFYKTKQKKVIVLLYKNSKKLKKKKLNWRWKDTDKSNEKKTLNKTKISFVYKQMSFFFFCIMICFKFSFLGYLIKIYKIIFIFCYKMENYFILFFFKSYLLFQYDITILQFFSFLVFFLRF